jgi:uncharacterized protein (DUF58 family)
MVNNSHVLLLKRQNLISKFTRHGRVYILPTRHGMAFLVALFFLFLLALTYGHSLAFAAAFFLTSLLMSSALLTNLNLKGLKCSQVRLPDVMRLGEFEDLQFLIENLGRRNRYDLMVESWGRHPCHTHVLKECLAEKEVWGRSTLNINTRGNYHADRINLSTTYPLGLFRAWITFPIESSVIIAPKAVEHGIIQERWVDIEDLERQTSAESEGSGEDFYQHSALQIGDSWKKIDWKAWAKKGMLLRKDFEGNSRQVVCYYQDPHTELTVNEQLEQMSWWLKKQEISGESFVFEINYPQYFLYGPAIGAQASLHALKKLAVI